ncbi:Uncharacterized protein YeaC [Durusdinium trenchii]|uniref:magnesium chelatase n=1 Tax=Durusdinium trenchii TaxID=1381693 RepID=A0ABP0J3T2_9DINO
MLEVSPAIETAAHDVDKLLEEFRLVEQRLNDVLKGKSDVVEMVLVCLLAQGHLLLEDKPGLGKTTLAKALATAIGGSFSRVQCTPDLLPGDITGFSIFNQRTHEFEFREGPVFADVLLADEINRATPRTQSALLEAMAERQVTVDAQRYNLSEQFFVMATQNPIDQHGTYPLPEAQLDRFAMKLSVGYPARNDEQAMLQAAVGEQSERRVDETALLEAATLAEAQRSVARTYVDECIQSYLLDFGEATRQHSQIHLGLSPRGLLIWQRVCQAKAFLKGRDFVTPDDVQQTAAPVLGVRWALNTETRSS